MKNKVFLFTLLMFCCNSILHAQCSFTATIVTTESRCKENGSITVNVTPAGSYTYEITSGPELSALSSSNVFTGLGAGNYTVTIHGSSCTLNLFATVTGNYQDPGLLTASTTKVICPGGTACLTTDQPTNGRPPYTYSIISGPVIRPSQSSRNFCGLTEGFYNVQALDSCGVVRTSTFSIGVDTGDFYSYGYNWDIRYANCNDLVLLSYKEYTNTSSHTLLKLWYVSPDGDTLKVNDFTDNHYDTDTLPGMAKKYGTWQLLVFDDCGRMRINTLQHNPPSNNTITYDPQCNGIKTLVTNPWRFGVGVGITIRRCSDSSIVYTEYNNAGSTNWYSSELLLDFDSCYIIETYNECGDTIRSSYTSPTNNMIIHAYGSTSCNTIGKSEIQVFLDRFDVGTRPITFTITAGPAHVGTSIVFTEVWSQAVKFEALTPGSYTIVATDACGIKDTANVTVAGLKRVIDILQTPHCSGGSNLHVKVSSNHMDGTYLSYYGLSGWLLTKVAYTTPSYQAYNVLSLVTSASTYEGFWEGDYFDVRDDSLKLTLSNVTAMTSLGCSFDTTIKINRYVPPTLQNVTGYVCSSTGTATLNYVVKNGVAPYRFRIKPDASAIWGSWQDSSIFTGITAGTYDINVEDACPNGSIRSVSFQNWQKSNVTFDIPCATVGSPVTLSADPAVSFVNYEWVFNNVVVGHGSSFTIPSFDPSDEGNYKLRQVFRGGTCIDSSSQLLLKCSILPLSIKELTGKYENGNNLLQWRTLNDMPGTKFYLERSTNGSLFNTIATINGVNEINGAAYNYKDNSAPAISFYRIMHESFDRKTGYSNTVRISKNDLTDNPVSLGPVPFKSWISVKIKSKITGSCSIKFFDLNGKPVFKKATNVRVGANVIWLDENIAELTAGMYVIEVATDEFVKRIKAMKQ